MGFSGQWLRKVASTVLFTFAVPMLPAGLFNSAITQAQTIEEKNAQAEALASEAFELFQLGTAESRQEAITKFEQALSLSEELEEASEIAIISFFLGGIYADLDYQQEALIYYQKALPLFQQLQESSWEAATLTGIGSVYSALGEKQKALDYYNQALSLSKTVGDRQGEGLNLNNIGSIY